MAETYKIAIIIEGKDRASRPLTGVGSALRNVGQVAGGILAARVFERIASGIGGMVRSALQAVTDYERLGLALQALSAREMLAMNHGERFTAWMKDNLQATDYQINRYSALRAEYERVGKKLADMVAKGQDQTAYYQRTLKYQEELKNQIAAAIPGYDKLSVAMKKAALGGLDMATALRNSIEPSKELLKWSIQLAIHSPFSTKGVVNAMKTAMAYGFTIDQAKLLTKTMIDFSAATGASGDVMDRIALALGQVRAKGRLMGQEILQLVNAGVPVNDILQDMGYNLQDIKKKGVPAAEFIQGFTKYMQENFGGAAARQTSTWAGLLNTLGDLKELGLKSFFEGAFAALQPLVGEFANWMQVVGLERLHKIGKRIGEITQFVVSLASADWDSVMLGFRHIFGLDIGKSAKFTGFLQDASQYAEGLAEKVSGLKDAVSNFVRGSLSQFISKYKDDFLAAAKNVGIVLGGALGIGVITALGSALLSLLTPLNILIAAVAFATLAWRRDWGGVREKTANVLSWLNGAFASISDAIAPVVSAIQSAIAPAFQMLSDSISEMGGILDNMQIADFGDILKQLGSIAQVVAEVIGGALVAVIIAAIGVFSSFVSAIATAISKALPGIVVFVNGIALVVQGALDFITGIATTFVDIIKALLGAGSWKQVTDDLGNLWESIKTIFTGIAQSVIGLVYAMIGTVTGFISGFVKGIIGFFTKLYDELVGHSIVPDMLNDILSAFSGWVTDTLKTIGTWKTKITNIFTGLADDFKSVGRSIINGLWDGMKAIWASVEDWLSSSVSKLLKIVQIITGTHSPSTKFAEIGRWWMEGLAQGIRSSAMQPQIAIAGAAAGALGAGASQTWNMHFHYGSTPMREGDLIREVQVAKFLNGG